MHGLMRKYRRHIIIVMIIMIAGPFIFWVVPSQGPSRDEMSDPVLINVDGIPVRYSMFIQQLRQTQNEMGRGGEQPTIEELRAQGVVDRILNNLIQEALLRREEARRDLTFSKPFLEDRMKEWFRNSDGRFDAAAWNDWVKEDPGRNWNALYEQVQGQANRDLSISLISAQGARVRDAKIEQEVEDEFTTLQVRFLKVEPPVEPDEEDIEKQYAENPDRYRNPQEMRVKFAAISLQPDPPPQALEIIERARAGEDFAELANAFSELPGGEEAGGFMGWQAPSELDLPHRLPLYDLAPGEVSDPVHGSGGYFIYKVEDERTDAETGAREVLARQIFLRATLAPEERDWRTGRAEQLLEKAEELGSLEEAAEELRLELQETGFFSNASTAVEPVPDGDVNYFKRAMTAPPQDEQRFLLARGQSNLYVGEVVETREGVAPPLEEVRDRVVQDVIGAEKRTDEYRERARELAEQIAAGAALLDEVPGQFPGQVSEIRVSQEFTGSSPFVSDLFVRAAEVFEEARDKEVGELCGPLRNMMGETIFFELTKREAPDDEARAGEEYQEALARKREEALDRLGNRLLADYLQYLLDNARDTLPIQMDEFLLAQALGIPDRPAESAVTVQEVTEAAADDAAEAVDDAPGEDAAEAPVAESVEAPAAETPAEPAPES